MDGQRETTLLPPGVRIYLTPDSRTKRHHVNQLFDRARRWNFQELDLPTLDYYDSITKGVSENLAHRTYQFHDDEGELLALRPDATAQVAKILSGRFPREELPGRYCYCTRNFRAFELRRGELREFTQFGAEILRDDRYQADSELLLFMMEQLRRLKLDEVVVDLGHVNIYKSLIDGVELDKSQSQALRKKIHRKNMSGLTDLLESLEIPDQRKEILRDLPDLYGNGEIFDEIGGYGGLPDATKQSVDYLHSIYKRIVGAGFQEWISLDFGVVLNLDYYTGIVFEVLSPGIGKPIIGGGRYDGLYGQYGSEIPATGFAIEIDRILPLLNSENEDSVQNVWCPDPTPEALSKLNELRDEQPVSVVFDNPDSDSSGKIVDGEGGIRDVEEN